jgi:hypothetical protein
VELENIILIKVRLRRPKITCSPSHEDYRPETNAVITGHGFHIKGRTLMEGIGKGKET